jgi:hypothetical protein
MSLEEWSALVNSQRERLRQFFNLADDDDIML